MNFFQLILSRLQKKKNNGLFSAKRHYWQDEEIVDFLMKLKQVIKWTEKLSHNFDFTNGFYGTVFRQTNPTIQNVHLYSFDSDYATWNLDDTRPLIYEQLLDLAINIRDKEYNIDLQKLDELGRILSFQTSVTTHDGAPIVSSQCFVDESDVPPIDTWFYLKSDYYHSKSRCDQVLFCWVPKKFEAVMQDAIDVEILNSYRWLDQNDEIMYDKIKVPPKENILGSL